MHVVLPRPLRESKETVTLSRSDWEALIERLGDAEDTAAIAARKSREKAAGVATDRRNYLTGDEMRRLLDWESPVRVWREKRGLSQRALAGKASVSPSYLAEIETGQKPGSADALLALSRALEVPMESLVSSNRPQVAYAQMKRFIEAGLSEAETVKAGRDIVAALKSHGVAWPDLLELRDRLRNLAINYGEAREADPLNAVIQRCLP